MHPELFVGLMSGTSLDGIDGVLCRFQQNGAWDGIVSHIHHPLGTPLRTELLALQSPGANELHRAALAGNALALAYAHVCADLLHAAEVSPAEVRAVGVHGQTLRHQPSTGTHGDIGYTLQLNQPALLAERCGIDVIADFRSRDVAAGGQGAPLVPPFHQAVFGQADKVRIVVNIGGMANLTVLAPGAALTGFDCGPGNALLDLWCEQHTGRPFDQDGQWAAAGQPIPALLSRLQAEPFLVAAPPKSTGRDLFNAAWLGQCLAACPGAADDPQAVQATLSEFTAWAIADHVRRYALQASEVLVCGGGALNDDLMRRLSALLPHGMALDSTALHGLPPLHVEAAAFAWLARMHWHGEPASTASVTGAQGTRILGARYPA